MMAACYYCSRQMSEPQAYTFMRPPSTMRTVDHIVARSIMVSVGGYPTDKKWCGMNKVAACFSCNNAKGDMYPLDWLTIAPPVCVERFAKRLLDLGAEQADIDAAIARRTT